MVLAGCGGTDSPTAATKEPSVFGVYGKLELTSTDGKGIFGTGSDCTGSDGYDDVKEGAQVTVRDDAGKSVALSKLGAGSVTKTLGKYAVASCEFDFIVSQVPVSGDIYSVEVEHRGAINFERKNASSLRISLGD